MNVEYSAEALKNLRKLMRRYRHIQSDLQPLFDQLLAGETPGDQVQGVGYPVYKVRVKNSDIKKGKSAGYRVLYYLRTEQVCTLITVYSKSDRADVPHRLLRSLVEQHLSNNQSLDD